MPREYQWIESSLRINRSDPPKKSSVFCRVRLDLQTTSFEIVRPFPIEVLPMFSPDLLEKIQVSRVDGRLIQVHHNRPRVSGSW